MAKDGNNFISRYSLIVVVIALCGIGIISRAIYTMYVKDDYWLEVAEHFRSDSLTVEPFRGNILSDDGELLASSLPEYTLYIDFKAGGFQDTTFQKYVDTMATDLHRIFPDKSKRHFKELLKNGYRNRNKRRNLRLYPERVSYAKYQELMSCPYFSLGPNRSGFYGAKIDNRQRPFGSIALRTIGDVSKDSKVGAKYGVELAFDSVLRGKSGWMHREKVRNTFVEFIDVPPVNGLDVVTTINVEMQDIVETTLRKKLVEIGAESGVAILMEAATGDIKAAANLGRWRDSVYYELGSYGYSDLMEPGSTFKTASIMVALDDGVIKTSDVVDTGEGLMMMYKRWMRDHNWRRGGYGPIDLWHIMMYSSNIGVSRLIDMHYHDNPQKFIDGLRRVGILQDWDFVLKEYNAPYVKLPGTAAWDETTLPWLSIGYNSQLPVLNTVAFYNAIASGGKLLRPRLVKALEDNGEVVKEFPVEVVREQICSPATLDTMRMILEKVVSEGLGKKAGNPMFHVSGKTGTAMVAENGRYGNKHFVSFAGYFPSEQPLYTCVVAITKRGPASGGQMSGDVFGRIAEQVYAKHRRADIESVVDSDAVHVPCVMDGNLTMVAQVLGNLGLGGMMDVQPSDANQTVWGTADVSGSRLDCEIVNLKHGYVPDVTGMGAMDAVYLMEKAGMKVELTGVGKVRSQSVRPGSVVKRGATVHLSLK
ncbi:MAG TPA: transpeptidase family protein [Candidatus Avibacteroides faecavium]|nr:transpeptidase family protein [Candidatus Avibacteroides faecavium]